MTAGDLSQPAGLHADEAGASGRQLRHCAESRRDSGRSVAAGWALRGIGRASSLGPADGFSSRRAPDSVGLLEVTHAVLLQGVPLVAGDDGGVFEEPCAAGAGAAGEAHDVAAEWVDGGAVEGGAVA